MKDLRDEIADVVNDFSVGGFVEDEHALADAILATIKASVPPLVWPVYSEGHTYQSAKPIVYGRPYSVRKYSKAGWKAFYDDQSISVTFDTIEAAQAAANAHNVAQLTDWMMK